RRLGERAGIQLPQHPNLLPLRVRLLPLHGDSLLPSVAVRSRRQFYPKGPRTRRPLLDLVLHHFSPGYASPSVSPTRRASSLTSCLSTIAAFSPRRCAIWRSSAMPSSLS